MDILYNPFTERMKVHAFPAEVACALAPFCASYLDALSRQGKSPEPFLPTFDAFLQGVAASLRTPPRFPCYHQAIRAPFDYYQLGVDFISPLLDRAHSSVQGKEVLREIVQKLAAHHNVIFFANHQTEIDPQIISLLLGKEFSSLAEQMIFVAGHRVLSDPLAVPLSLGRNLLCIYSKRHMDYPPEKKIEKMQHNTRVMKILEELLSEGGKCIYVAPGGGRDRRAPDGVVTVTPFDPQSIETFFLIAKQASKITHFHTLAMHTYRLLPPPNHIAVELGEARPANFAPAHLVFGPEIDTAHLAALHTTCDKKAGRQARATYIWEQVVRDYSQISLQENI